MANEVRLCRLVDGTYCIGKVGEEAVNDIIAISLTDGGEERGIIINFMPFMFPFNRELSGMFIGLSRVMVHLPVPEDILAEYTQATTGIIPASTIPTDLKNNFKK